MFKKFEDIQIGDCAELSKTITEEDVRKFVDMTGDDNPLHVNRRYAEQTPFKDIVVHGMLGASFISTVIGTRLPGKGALWVSQNMEFLRPVRLGDTLIIRCKVLNKIKRERLLELETSIQNQDKQPVLSGKGLVKVLEEEKEKQLTNQQLEKRIALVTGGAGGIGKAICLSLAKEGFHVAIHYHRQAGRAKEVLAEIMATGGPEAIVVQADLAKEAEAQRLYEVVSQKLGAINLLVNNASPSISPKNIDVLAWDDIQKQMDVQVKAAFWLSKCSIPNMQAQGWGRILHITSQAIEGAPTIGWTAYAMAKGALSIFSKQMAAELAPNGITVNCIAPGMCETTLIGDISEKTQQIIARQTPNRRLAHPKDIAAAVVFLASKEAGHMNGQTLSINGGMVMR